MRKLTKHFEFTHTLMYIHMYVCTQQLQLSSHSKQQETQYKENSHGTHTYKHTCTYLCAYVCMNIQPISDYASFNVVCIHMHVCTYVCVLSFHTYKHTYEDQSVICTFACMYIHTWHTHIETERRVYVCVCATFEISRHMSFPILYCVKIHKCVQFRWCSKLTTIWYTNA